ncbi:hypothetical protein Glove_241g24 [Diversispora epigaea]|uniref:RNase H type-1 domain-containing protein n=1 Tax=Diversispora epigaea TaxID=1348612 RepID=A0A397IH75_9GLOM|nr:hypothetical protein Glove_241g24 [Diversispora epigaea]
MVLTYLNFFANASANLRKAHRKLKNWTLVKAIKEIANIQDLTLQLKKVKAHSGVIHNETADQLARESCLKPVCYPNLQSLTSVNVVSYWNTEIIEEPLKHFIKKLEKLKDRFPMIYKNDSCICCNLEKEDQVHVLTCSKNLIDIHSCRNRLINMLVTKTTTVAYRDTCKNMSKILKTLKELHIPRDVSARDTNHLSFINVMLGLISIIDRCTAVKKREIENGISNNK